MVKKCKNELNSILNKINTQIKTKCETSPWISLSVKDRECLSGNFVIGCDEENVAVNYDIPNLKGNIKIAGVECDISAESSEMTVETIYGINLEIPKDPILNCSINPKQQANLTDDENENRLVKHCEFWKILDKNQIIDKNIEIDTVDISIINDLGCCGQKSDGSNIIDDEEWRAKRC